MNLLLTSVGRRGYLVEYFKEALAGQGQVHAANNSMAPGLWAADKQVLTPLIYDGTYIPFLLDYCKANQIELLISLFDIDLPILAAHRQDFCDIGVTVVISDPEVIHICNDKWETFSFLTAHQIPVPRTYRTLEAAREALDGGAEQFPLMVKPRWGMGSLAIYEADNLQELEVFYKKSYKNIRESYLKYEALQEPEFCVMIQEKLKGDEFGLDVINDLDGNYVTTIAKQKYAMRSGETDSAKTVQVDELCKLGATLGGLLRHRGNMDVDVFRSDGRFYVLEMNARFGGGYPFSHMAGVNLPKAIVNWKMGKPIKKEWLEPEVGVCSQKDIKMVRLDEMQQ